MPDSSSKIMEILSFYSFPFVLLACVRQRQTEGPSQVSSENGKLKCWTRNVISTEFKVNPLKVVNNSLEERWSKWVQDDDSWDYILENEWKKIWMTANREWLITQPFSMIFIFFIHFAHSMFTSQQIECIHMFALLFMSISPKIFSLIDFH